MSHGYALSRCRCWLRCLLSQLSVGTPLLLLGLVAARPAFADKALIHVFINQRQESGRPWHGIGDPILGHFILKSPNEAPGAVLCVVSQDGQSYCIREQHGRLESPCPQSYDCDFRHVELPGDEIFGIVVLDPALVFVHLVDAVVITRTPMGDEDPKVRRMDAILRNIAARRAPPIFTEVQRRSRPFPVTSLSDCDDR